MERIYGRGPWYSCRLRNRINGKEQTRVHTYCFRIPAILNELNPEDDWVLEYMIGPYPTLSGAIGEECIDGLTIWKRKPEKTKKRVRLPEKKPLKMKEIKKMKRTKN